MKNIANLLTNTSTIKRYNIIAFVILFELFFLLIVYKIFHVPIVHDEMATTTFYSNFSYWEIMMYPDNWPNNHILNTIFTKFFISIFGAEQWVVRLPNLLSFLVYAFAIFRINKSVLKLSSVFFIPASILFICNPYLLDFFGLCRGYAMSCTLSTLSVSFFISGFAILKAKHIWVALFLAMLASYANFTLLVFFAAAAIVTWIYFFIQYLTLKKYLLKNTLFLILFCIAYGALIAVPIIKMQSTDQFQYWEALGFYKGTIFSSVQQLIYGTPYGSPPNTIINAFSIFAIVIVFGNLVYVSQKFIRSNFNLENLQKPVFIASIIILLSAFISKMLSIILHTPDLFGRTALFFFPLLIISLITSISFISENKAIITKGFFSILVSLFLLFHITDMMSLKCVREWWYDQNTFDVIDYFNKVKPNNFVSLKTNWLFQPSLYFYKYTGKIPLIDLKGYDKAIDINTAAEYYYIDAGDYYKLKSKFDIVYKFNKDRFLLKRRL